MTAIYTKLKEYPYKFEIDNSLQIVSIDNVKINNNGGNIGMNIQDDDLKKWIEQLGEFSLSLEDVLEGRLLTKLMNSKPAIDYMVENERIMEAILNSQNAITELSKSDYASYKVYLKDELWIKLKSSEYFTAFHNNRLVTPILTGPTSEIEEAETNYAELHPYRVFSTFIDATWIPTQEGGSPLNRYVGFSFYENKYVIYGYSFSTYMNANYSVNSAINIIGKKNGEWLNLKENVGINYNNSVKSYSNIIDNKEVVTGVGIKFISSNVIRTRYHCGYTGLMRFYGFKLDDY